MRYKRYYAIIFKKDNTLVTEEDPRTHYQETVKFDRPEDAEGYILEGMYERSSVSIDYETFRDQLQVVTMEENYCED